MNQIDQKKVDLLLQYILAVAGQETGWDRELGMIHLIKYAYLADLSYSEYHDGETYTGLPWRFHHLGPWSAELYNRIEPALAAIGAKRELIKNPKDDKDFARWTIDDDQLFDELGNKIGLAVMGSVQQNVHRFGKDTPALLDYVYKTLPMIKAAPGELLDFSPEEIEADEEAAEIEKMKPTARQMKKRKARLKALKQRINERIDKELIRTKECALPPRYDDVFFQGIRWLDSLAGEPIEQGDLTVSISDNLWKSKARFDPDVSG